MKIKEFYNNHKQSISFLFDLLIEIVIYGFMINMPMKFIFNQRFSLFTILSYGIMFYFIKYEFTRLWRQIFPRK